MSVHHPREEYRSALIDSMHRFGAAMHGRPGLISAQTLQDAESGRLVGLAVFESEAAFRELAPLARAAVDGDPFELWERVETDGLRLIEV